MVRKPVGWAKGDMAKEKARVSLVSATRVCGLVTQPGSVPKAQEKALTWLSIMLGNQRWKVSRTEVKR
jgi:hypothetical protein